MRGCRKHQKNSSCLRRNHSLNTGSVITCIPGIFRDSDMIALSSIQFERSTPHARIDARAACAVFTEVLKFRVVEYDTKAVVGEKT